MPPSIINARSSPTDSNSNGPSSGGGVPIAMFFATHFYFSSYHVLANLVLRKARTAHAPGWRRAALTVALIGAMSYTTAFMETLTISNFPYYDFENRDLAYTLGSAFYAIYFIVSRARLNDIVALFSSDHLRIRTPV